MACIKTQRAGSFEHWMITPGRVAEYRKTREWLKMLQDAGEKAAAAAEAEMWPSAVFRGAGVLTLLDWVRSEQTGSPE
jgi:hypothetical protein